MKRTGPMQRALAAVAACRIPSAGRLLLALLIGLLLAGFFLVHHYDLRLYNVDADTQLTRAVDAVDHWQFPWANNFIIPGINLGPLGYLLSAIPLLFSRSLYGQYYFLSLLMLLAAPVMFFAARMLAPQGVFAAAVTFFYMFLSLFAYTPLVPEHTYYLPLGLALYFYFLAKAYARGAPWAALAAWIAAGLCMHLHMAAFTLLPATFIALWPNGKDWRLALFQHMVGVATALAFNGQVFEQVYRLARHGSLAAAVVANPHVAGTPGFFRVHVIAFLTSTPLLFGNVIAAAMLAASVFGIVAITRNKKLRWLSAACLFIIGGDLLIFAVLSAFKAPGQGFSSWYYFPAILHIAILCGLALDWLWQATAEINTPGRISRDIALTVVIGGFVVFAVATQIHNRVELCERRPPDNIWLRDQVNVAESFYRYLEDRNLRDVSLRMSVVGPTPDVRTGFPLTTLIRHLHPDASARFSTTPHEEYAFKVMSKEVYGRRDAATDGEELISDLPVQTSRCGCEYEWVVRRKL